MPNAVLHLVATVPAPIVHLGILSAGGLVLPSSFLPHLMTALVAWTVLSVPASLLIGHCVLGED